MTDAVLAILQIIVGLGLLNVWLLRAGTSTAYRGGDSKSLAEEFAAYGLPPWSFYAVGTLKVGAALCLLAGLWVEALVLPAAAIVAMLMGGAVSMHVKVSDPPLKALPASLVLLMSATIVALRLM